MIFRLVNGTVCGAYKNSATDPTAFNWKTEWSADDFSEADRQKKASRRRCLGNGGAIALKIGVGRELTERLPDLRLCADQTLEYSPNITFRGPRRLHVEW